MSELYEKLERFAERHLPVIFEEHLPATIVLGAFFAIVIIIILI